MTNPTIIKKLEDLKGITEGTPIQLINGKEGVYIGKEKMVVKENLFEIYNIHESDGILYTKLCKFVAKKEYAHFFQNSEEGVQR